MERGGSGVRELFSFLNWNMKFWWGHFKIACHNLEFDIFSFWLFGCDLWSRIFFIICMIVYPIVIHSFCGDNDAITNNILHLDRFFSFSIMAKLQPVRELFASLWKKMSVIERGGEFIQSDVWHLKTATHLLNKMQFYYKILSGEIMFSILAQNRRRGWQNSEKKNWRGKLWQREGYIQLNFVP